MVQKHPFLKDGSAHGITRTQFRRMRKAQKRELMLQWFSSRYEDPAENTPYESAEGGHQYFWGGPYEARDELYAQFGDMVPEQLIEEVAEELEHEGIVDWAPVQKEDEWDTLGAAEDEVKTVCAVRFRKEDELPLSYMSNGQLDFRILPDFDKDPGVVMMGSKNFDKPPMIIAVIKNETDYDITRARMKHSFKFEMDCSRIPNDEWEDGPELRHSRYCFHASAN